MTWNPDIDMSRRAHDRAVFNNGGWWTVLAWVAQTIALYDDALARLTDAETRKLYGGE